MTLPASVSVNRTDLVPAATFEKVVETPPATVPESRVVPSAYDLLDRSMTAEIARFTGGLSPAALALAFADWAIHLAASPGKKLALGGEVLRDVSRLADMSVHWATKFKPWSLIKPPP